MLESVLGTPILIQRSIYIQLFLYCSPNGRDEDHDNVYDSVFTHGVWKANARVAETELWGCF